MPINPKELNKRENSYILAPATKPVGQVLAALERAGGKGWWHLVVDLGDGRFGAIKFNDLSPLAQSLGADFFRRPVGDLICPGGSLVPAVISADECQEVGAGIPEAVVVEQDAMGTNAARDLAYRSPGKLVVVTQAGRCVGILRVGSLRVFDQAPLLSLFGDFKEINREEYALWDKDEALADQGEPTDEPKPDSGPQGERAQ